MGNECSSKLYCCGNEHEINTDQEVKGDSNKQSKTNLTGPQLE